MEENSELLCPIGCFAISSNTDSGTGVGPGIIKNVLSFICIYPPLLYY